MLRFAVNMDVQAEVCGTAMIRIHACLGFRKYGCAGCSLRHRYNTHPCMLRFAVSMDVQA